MTIAEIGHAVQVEQEDQSVFRVPGPMRDLNDLPSAELFLAVDRRSEQQFKVLEVRIASKAEVVVAVDFAQQYPKNLTLFAKNDPTVVMKALVAFLEAVEETKLADVMSSRGALAAGQALKKGELNSEQELALGAMVCDGLSLVWGPPGTGKTRVIGEAVATFLSRGQTVALVSNTNVAVDQALLQVCKDVPNFKPGQVLRLGHPSLAGVTEHPFLTAERAARTIGEELTRELNELTEQLNVARGLRDDELSMKIQELIEDPGSDVISSAADHRKKLDSRKGAAEHLERKIELEVKARRIESDTEHRLDILRDEVAAMTEHAAIASIERDLVGTREELDQRQASLDSLSDQAMSAASLPLLKRRKTAKALTEEQQRVEKEVEDLAVAIAQAEQEISSAIERGIETKDYVAARSRELEAREAWKSAQARVEFASAEVARSRKVVDDIDALPPLSEDEEGFIALIDELGGLEAFQERLGALKASSRERKKQVAVLTARIEEIQKELSGLAEKIVASAPVIGTTLAQLFIHRALAGRTFDHVIVDEVSAALPPMVFGALAKARLGATLVGDFEQNGPICNTKKEDLEKLAEDARPWLEAHSFEHFGIDSAGAAQMKHGCRILTKQYRFGPATMELANEVAYGGLLEAGRRWLPDDESIPEITIIDTSALGEAALVKPGERGRGRWWPIGPAVSLAIAQAHAGTEVGIVTPYRDQMKMTKAWLGDQGVQNTLVGTAHAFQGQEFPIVLVDLVEDGTGKSWVAQADRRGSSWSLGGVRLFNVAVTRNAGHLYLLANAGAIRAAQRGPLQVVGDMLRAAKIAIIDAREVMGLDVPVPEVATDDHFEVQPLPAQADFDLFDGEDFYSALISDLQVATSDVIIYSPFVAKGRLVQILPVLEAHAARGVTIKVVTKSDEELDRPEILKELRQAGISVRQVRGMHEKVIVVDRRVSYFGSLNALSNNGRTGELMMRFVGSDYAREILSRLGDGS